jgi:hypothetical protein
MKRIEIERPDGTVMVYATNDDGGGAFVRRENDGAYHQMAGNSQTPGFKTPKQLLKYVNEPGAKIVAKYGW